MKTGMGKLERQFFAVTQALNLNLLIPEYSDTNPLEPERVMPTKTPLTNPKVDRLLNHAKSWKAEQFKLREIVLACGLQETIKWRQACYQVDGKNVVIISAFKDHCVLGFFKGALLKDPGKLLVFAGENTRSAKHLRLTSVAQIKKLDKAIRAMVLEAVKVEKAGLKVEGKAEIKIPAELTAAFEKKPALKRAFEALTPGRQRAYCMHFSGAKQSATRAARIEKYTPKILSGKGMLDQAT